MARRKSSKFDLKKTLLKIVGVAAFIAAIAYWRKATFKDFQKWGNSIGRNFKNRYWFDVYEGTRVPNEIDVINNTGNYRAMIPQWQEYKKKIKKW